MTKPTQAQIEAAAKAICRVYFGDIVTHGDARCCQLGGLDGCCLETLLPVAKAALTAAAEVGVATDEQDYYLQGYRAGRAEASAEIERLRAALAAERERCAQRMETYEGFSGDEQRIAAAAIRARTSHESDR